MLVAPIERLETVLNDNRERKQNAANNYVIINSLNEAERRYAQVLVRIRNRVASFIRPVEATILVQEADRGTSQLKQPSQAFKIFIGHGRSSLWHDLKDFIADRLQLSWDEFNREPAASMTTRERLEEMLDQSCFAFLVMTAEDEHMDGSLHARENVIHEVGLFQGKLGFKKAIVLLEDGCTEFSNIHGLVQIRYPKIISWQSQRKFAACFNEKALFSFLSPYLKRLCSIT